MSITRYVPCSTTSASASSSISEACSIERTPPPVPELPRPHRVHVDRETRQIAAAAGARDVGAGAQHARSREPAALDPFSDREVGERAERTDIAHGGEACLQNEARVAHPDDRVLRAAAHHQRGVALALFLAPRQM